MKKPRAIIISILILAALAVAGIGLAKFYFTKQANSEPADSTVKPPVKADEFSNGQPYLIYKDENFEIKYPNWPNINPANIASPATMKVAVINAGCSFAVNSSLLPADMNFYDYTRELVKRQAVQYKFTLIEQNIGATKAYFIVEIPAGADVVKNVSYAYLSKNQKQTYGVAFAANKDIYDTACQPVVDEVIASIKLY